MPIKMRNYPRLRRGFREAPRPPRSPPLASRGAAEYRVLAMPTTTSATTQLARRLFSADVAVAEVDPRDVLPEAVLWESERPAVARASCTGSIL